MTQDLTRKLLAIMFIVLLGAASLWISSPFLPALTWATMLVVATWPIMLSIQNRLGGRRAPATALMVLIILLVLFLPILVVIGSLFKYSEAISSIPALLAKMTLPPLPGWLVSIPFLGPWLAEKWNFVLSMSMSDISQQLAPYAGDATRWMLGRLGNLGLLIVNLILVAILSALLYYNGEKAGCFLMRFGHRLAGDHGKNSIMLAAKAIRAVAAGIIVTAVVQALVGAIGLAIAGIPYVGMLTALMILFGIAQIGSAPVVFACSLWLFWSGENGWGVALLVWTVIVAQIDNFLRPYLIKRGVNLPLPLIFAGVIGGLISMGVIGLFIGPMVLAVTHELLQAWINEDMPDPNEKNH